MISPTIYLTFRHRIGFKPYFDSRGVMSGVGPESIDARKWCDDNLDDNDFGYGWTGYSRDDSYMFFFRNEIDLLAFKLRFKI